MNFHDFEIIEVDEEVEFDQDNDIEVEEIINNNINFEEQENKLNAYNQNYKILTMKEIKFDEIEKGKYTVLFIGRNNAYLFPERELVPKYHLDKACTKIIFETIKDGIFKRIKISEMFYRDYNIKIQVKIVNHKRYNNYYFDDYVICKKVNLLGIYYPEKPENVNDPDRYTLYNEKDLMKNYKKYSKIYFHDPLNLKIVKKIIHKQIPEDININHYPIFEDEDDEVRIYTPEEGFRKIRFCYKPNSETEYQEIRIYDRERLEEDDYIDNDKIGIRKRESDDRKDNVILNDGLEAPNFNGILNHEFGHFDIMIFDYDYEEEFIMQEGVLHNDEIFERNYNHHEEMVIQRLNEEEEEFDLDDHIYEWEIINLFEDEEFYDNFYNYNYEIKHLFDYKYINDEDNFILI